MEPNMGPKMGLLWDPIWAPSAAHMGLRFKVRLVWDGFLCGTGLFFNFVAMPRALPH